MSRKRTIADTVCRRESGTLTISILDDPVKLRAHVIKHLGTALEEPTWTKALGDAEISGHVAIVIRHTCRWQPIHQYDDPPCTDCRTNLPERYHACGRRLAKKQVEQHYLRVIEQAVTQAWQEPWHIHFIAQKDGSILACGLDGRWPISVILLSRKGKWSVISTYVPHRHRNRLTTREAALEMMGIARKRAREATLFTCFPSMPSRPAAPGYRQPGKFNDCALGTDSQKRLL